jgi:hypothetical protein
MDNTLAGGGKTNVDIWFRFWHYIRDRKINMLILFSMRILIPRKMAPQDAKTMKLGYHKFCSEIINFLQQPR